ncbi:DUF4332 domain-containing protein [Oligoflexaceae bacterium]|nr:DUF4332 domain-containing protein [Oligoflexaceae bacterium]
MSQKISSIEGIGPAFAEKLGGAGITTVESLLKHGSTKKGRKQVASDAGVNESTLLNWVNMADLFRIQGVGGQFAELLKASGVDTAKELSKRNADKLHNKLLHINKEKRLTRVVPSPEKIADFIDHAKKLDQQVFH